MNDEDRQNFNIKHCAYADNLGGAGKLFELRKWWGKVEHYGPLFGYYPKATKSWLIVKDKRLDKAKELFRNTSINITTGGQKYLGSFIGNKESKENYIKKLVNEWIVQVDKLSKIALFEPQAAYTAYLSGFQHNTWRNEKPS